MNLLIIENDALVALSIKKIFAHVPHMHHIETSLFNEDKTITLALSLSFDIILIDVFDKFHTQGIELCKRIRKENPACIIIALSGLHSNECMKIAFDAGVNDFIAKPFSREELKIRVNRWQTICLENTVSNHNVFQYEELSYFVDQNKFYFKDQEIPLTPRNKFLLLLFLKKPEMLFRSEYLREKLWVDYFYEKNRNVRSNIHLLKRSLHGFCDTWIQNVFGEGYMLKKI